MTSTQNKVALITKGFAYIGLLIFVFLLCLGYRLSGQTDSLNIPYDSTLIDANKIRFQQVLFKECFFASSPMNTIKDDDIPKLKFKPAPFGKNRASVSPSLIEHDIYFKFTVFNNADSTRHLYFMPSRYCKNVSIFKASPGKIDGTSSKIPDSVLNNEAFAGARLLTIPANDTSTFYTRFNFLRTNVNSFRPLLIEMDYLEPALQDLKMKDPSLDMATHIASGILLLMIFYSLAAYIQYLNIEFIYYSAYTFCSGLLLFSKSYLNMDHTAFNFFYEEYLDFILLCAGVFFYLIFVRKFLNTTSNYPFLDKLLRISNVLLIILLAAFSMIYFFTEKYLILLVLENYVIKVFLCLIGILFIGYSLRKSSTLLKYLAAGNFCLVFFSMISLCLIVFNWKIVPSDRFSLWNRPLIYYELGIVLELICFLAGLAYKNRRDIIDQVKERERFKLENERKEFEKQMAVMAAQQDERNRISADMHDELGSGVTAIRLMSEIVKTKMKQTSIPEIEKISNSANDLLSKMNTIIWTMKSSNDSLESLAAYIRAHAIEFFDSTPIECTVHVADVPDIEMTGEKRRNIFLSVKEALNNIMKHSQATRVQIEISVIDDKLIIKIADNGIGIKTEKLRRFGNGLSNMKRRMQNIHGDFNIQTDEGTVLYFELPV
jgi:signal transduction histidine kinase